MLQMGHFKREKMQVIFGACTSLTALDVSGWDVSSAANMGSMFAFCSSLAIVDVSRWDTSSVTDMHEAFSACASLSSLDLSRWDTSSVKSVSEMFACMESLRSLAIGDGWAINLAETGLGVMHLSGGGVEAPPSIVVYDAAGSSFSLKDVPLGAAAIYYLDSHYVPKS